jgi:hypothetical protein
MSNSRDGNPMKFHPHNARFPIDLRNRPVCYLCGNAWELVEKLRGTRKREGLMTWRVIVQCKFCKLMSLALADRSVMHSREWIRCRR